MVAVASGLLRRRSDTSEVAPVDRGGGRADERLDDGVAASGVAATADVLLAVVADGAPFGPLPGPDGVADLVALQAHQVSGRRWTSGLGRDRAVNVAI